MFRLSTLVIALLLCIPASAKVTKKSQAKKAEETKAQTAASQPQAPAVSAVPASPSTLEDEPSSPPQVTFQNGQLTIEARNSTMSDVLNAVKQKTGAAVDMPAVSSERVVGRFGPGAPRDVMAQLLNGSHYDYVLLGSPADPGALKKIVLIARAAGPEPVAAAQPAPQNQPLQAVPEIDADQNVSDDTTPDVPPEIPQTPDEPQQIDQGQQDQQPQTGSGPVIKTPEQLLRELQQQQQQQQQNQPQQ